MIKSGDVIKLYPHNKPDQAVKATVLMIAKARVSNRSSVLLALGDKPSFADMRDGVAIHPDHGVLFFGMHYGVGPWEELFGGGHYEIEEIKGGDGK